MQVPPLYTRPQRILSSTRPHLHLLLYTLNPTP